MKIVNFLIDNNDRIEYMKDMHRLFTCLIYLSRFNKSPDGWMKSKTN